MSVLDRFLFLLALLLAVFGSAALYTQAWEEQQVAAFSRTSALSWP